MTHSTITSKGQTTLPAVIRRALRLKAGDRISYELHGDSVVIRPQPGAMAVFGALKPPAGKTGVPFECNYLVNCTANCSRAIQRAIRVFH